MSNHIVDHKLNHSLSSLNNYTNAKLSKLSSVSQNNIVIPKTISSKLSVLQKTFQELYTSVNCSNAESNTHIHDVSTKKLSQLLEKFAGGSIADSILDSDSYQALDTSSKCVVRDVAELEKLMVLYITLVLYKKYCSVLLRGTIPLSNDLSYWDGLLVSKFSFIIYAFQEIPSKIVDLSHLFLNEFGKLRVENIEAVEPPAWLTDYKDTYNNLLRLKSKISKTLGLTLNNFTKLNPGFILSNLSNFNLANIDDDSGSMSSSSYLQIALSAPFYSTMKKIEGKRDALKSLQESNANKLGYLISSLPNYDILNEKVVGDEFSTLSVHTKAELLSQNVNNLQIIFDHDNFSSDILASQNELTTTECFHKLIKITGSLIPIMKETNSNIYSSNRQPGFWFKFWPLVSLITIYGPSTSINIIANRDEIFNWVKTNVIATVVGFYKNWIIKPINNILSTVRHDDNSRIAIVSKQSLNSDLDSLERMVIDYTIDTSGTRMTPAEIELYKQQIKELVSSGDLTPLMKGYESELKSPIKNLIGGNLTRALLIQLQKTKVDGELAINGIDKLLKSQELLFGLVAASPSLLICFYLFKNLRLYLKQGYLSMNSTPKKLTIRKNLNNIERLLNLKLNITNRPEKKQDSKKYYFEGMLVIENISLVNNSYSVIPNSRINEWLRDLNDLNDLNLSIQIRLNTVQRVWNNYSQFF